MRLRALGLALLAWTSVAGAQTLDEAPPTTDPVEAAATLTGPIVSVVIATPLRGEDPWQRVGLSPGLAFTAARAREALRHALASGTFASGSVSARAVDGGVELVLRGERRYHLVDLDVRGASARDPELVREDADLHGDMTVTEATVTEALRRVEESYREAGFPDAHATAEWRETGTPGARELTLRVAEGVGLRARAVEITHVAAEFMSGAREAAGITAGDLAGPVRVRVGEEALTTWLRRTGFLDVRVVSSVTPLPDGGARVRYDVTPGSRYVMAWYGALSLPEESLLESLRLGEEQGFTDATPSSFAARVQDFYARRAWSDARVRASLAPETADGTRTLRFSIVEGRQVLVRSMRFPGATVLSEEELRTMVEEAARAELPATPHPYRGRIWRERTFTVGAYGTAAQRIVDAYRERGYLDAAVATPVTAREDTPEGPRLDVTLRVTEGPRSYVEELVFDGNRALPSAALAEAWGLPLGVALSYREVSEARVRLSDWYREKGYAFARVEPEIERSPDHTRARVRVVVHEGPRVRIGRVEVRGNSTTRDAVLRSRLDLREGDTFSLSGLRASQRQLYDLGVFSAVNVGLEDGDIEAPVKTLLVRVVQDRRVRLEMRAGFSLGQGARLGLEFALLDIGGFAMNLAVRPEAGYLLPVPLVAPTAPTNVEDWDIQRFSYRLPVSLAFPFLPGVGPRFSASLDAVVSRALQPWALALTTYGIGGTLTWRPIPRFSLSLTNELQNIDVGVFGDAGSIRGSFYTNCINSRRPQNPPQGWPDAATVAICDLQARQQAQSFVRYIPGRSLLFATRLGAVWDGRDNPLTPRSGYYASVTTEVLNLLGFDAAPGSTDAASKTPADRTLHVEARFTGYVPLFSRVVLALSARGGYNHTLSGSSATSTHPSRLFWLGGAGSMRGWTQNQLVPQDRLQSAPAAGVALAPGGDLYVNMVADLRVPLAFISNSFEVGAFLDVGNVWADATNFIDDFALRYSPGVGLRYVSPVGIVALDVGFVIAPVTSAGESVFQTLQFYLGNTL